MRTLSLLVGLMTLLACGCGEGKTRDAKKEQGQEAIAPFPPVATTQSTEEVRYTIPEDEPMRQQGHGGMDTFGSFRPKRGSFSITGGAIVTSRATAPPVRARFGDWSYIYMDAARTKEATWSPVLTKGDVLVTTEMLLPFPGQYTELPFTFDAEVVGEGLLAIHLRPEMGQRLGMLGTTSPCAGAIGAVATYKGRKYECRIDGWYCGDQYASQIKPGKLMKLAELWLTEFKGLEEARTICNRVIATVDASNVQEDDRAALAAAHLLRAVALSDLKADPQAIANDARQAKSLSSDKALHEIADKLLNDTGSARP